MTTTEILDQLELGSLTEAQALEELKALGVGEEAQFWIDLALGRIEGDIE